MARTVLHLSPAPRRRGRRACRRRSWRCATRAGASSTSPAGSAGRHSTSAGARRWRRPAAAPASSCCRAIRRCRCPRATISPPRRRRSWSCSAECCPRSLPALVCAPVAARRRITRTSSSAAPRGARSRRTPAPAPPLWLWGVWADLPFPTLIAPFDRARLAEIQDALAAHASELARLPLDRLVEARAVLNAGVGEERVYGSGLAGDPSIELAELLCEVVLGAGRLEARLAAALRRRGAAGLCLGAPDRLVARGRVGARAPAPWRAAAASFSAHVGAQRVARDQEPALDQLHVALEGAVLVLDRDPAVVADGVERRAEAIPAHLAEARAGAVPASSCPADRTPCS